MEAVQRPPVIRTCFNWENILNVVKANVDSGFFALEYELAEPVGLVVYDNSKKMMKIVEEGGTIKLEVERGFDRSLFFQVLGVLKHLGAF